MKSGEKSTDYPRVSLPELLRKARNMDANLFTGEHDEEAIARGLGYSGISGASIVYLSSLRRFGFLVKTTNKKFSLQSEFQTLLNSDGTSAEFKSILEEATFRPDIFFEIREYFGKILPPSEELSRFLGSKKFAPTALPRLINSYRESFKYLARVSGDYLISEFPENSGAFVFAQPTAAGASGFRDGNAETPALNRIEVNLGGLLKAAVIFSGEITQKSIDRLIRFLEANKSEFPEDD